MIAIEAALSVFLLCGAGLVAQNLWTLISTPKECARRFGLGGDVLRKQIFGDAPVPITIVGMVGDVRTRGLQAAPVPEVYLSSLQIDGPNVYLIVRSTIPPGQLVKLVKALIHS